MDWLQRSVYDDPDTTPQPWLSPYFRTVILGTVFPGCVGLLILAVDLLLTIRVPGHVRRVYLFLTAPFRDFLTLEDLEERASPAPPPPEWKARILVVGAVLECVGWSAVCSYTALVGDTASAVQAGVATVAWIYASLRVLFKPPTTPPYLLLSLSLTYAAVAFVDFTADLLDDRYVSVLTVLRIVWPITLIWVAGTLRLESTLPTEKVAMDNVEPSNELSMPEDNATLWSWSTFSFIEPIFGVASKGTLNETDVWNLSPYFTHKNLFNKYLKYREAHPTHSLLRFLLASNSLDLILDITLELWSAVIGFVPPYALQQILSALSDPAPGSRRTAYVYALVAFLANLSFAQKDLYQTWYTRRCYERTRGQLFCALHYKALTRRDVSGKAGNAAEQEDGESADLGKIVNLMQGDAYSVAQRFWEFSGVFAAPVRIGIALVFLYQILGWSSLAAVVVVLVAYVLNYPLAKYNIYITRQSWKVRDKRMSLVNELFQNVRFLKFYGWESRWSYRVRDARETELKWRVKDNIVSVLITFIWTWMPSATAVSTFLCYTLVAGEKLTVAKAFTSIALFSYLQEPMTALPGQFFALLHAYVSMQRIEAFLNEAEVPEWASSLKMSEASRVSISQEVGFRDAIFEWDISPRELPSRFQLGPLDISFPKGKLTLVSGPTGSGKSALLAALLGEMHCIHGSVTLNKADHQVAYCAQNPWLEHATIRDNIIFGSKYGYDERRYQAVIEACALVRDLEIFDAGDMTEIGEKGITLSGGQRARIALARALYSQASCILLDDPLAAVDMHTAQHLVKKALSGELVSDRTIILVTHHISLCLPIASYLVELSAGTVVRQGFTQDLREQGQLQRVVSREDIPSPEIEERRSESSSTEVENEADMMDQDFPAKSKSKGGGQTGKLIEAEARAEGRVSARTYLTYIRAAGLFSWFLTVLLMILIRLITIGNQFFIARWGEAYENMDASLFRTVLRAPTPWANLPSPNVDVRPWLAIFLAICLAGALCVITYISIGYYASLQASRSLFMSMLVRLAGAPSRFFDVTPIGRILNRFTSDINTVDYALQNSARAALSGCFNFLASLSVIIWVVPSFAPFALFIAWLYIRLAPPYVRASRDLRRLESISLSPAFAGFDELLRGLAHVRAFAMEERYQDRFYKRVDKFQSFDHVYWLVSGWLRWRYDCLGSVVVFLTTLFALWGSVSSGFAALVIVQAGVFAEASRMLVRVLAQLELDFNSVERIVEYLGVSQEAPAIVPNSRPPAYWPSSNGELVVEDLVVKYAPDLPAVLHSLSFRVRPTEKIGVVGRTGSGKSTLALSLLRMIEPTEGRIIIDNIDITKIGLGDLRTRITIISQDVSLFTGTIRSNLDPFGEHTDAECWEALERCHLTSVLRRSASKTPETAFELDMPISQTGSLSAGERQLVAMARAVLRRSNVVIMDEATSQIDSKLDDQIQRTIHEEFAGAIVITIAHRLRTVLDYDRILVLGGGEILEFDTPRALISKQGGVFREMCRASTDWTVLLGALDA
ncbi:pleiotropic drug resistance ABC transporter [Wolfiporia cocos MD-104 SS10]|uniref:Pleiotropic drug resistance ABC transporter n=1 Tax=Wolfiporia cocos (strain MD-104) TaxID=742152 RepID=A0A2H3JJR2_WOLCO|nr:pleiotropic drug resistance ABC transporter [Wolfiporia cocos MD-104 SS10]